MELQLAADNRASPVEQGLIAALSARFPTDDPTDTDALVAGHGGYADAMVELAVAYPDDLDVQALAADGRLLEAFVPLRIHVLVRFGRWDELIAEPLPTCPQLYSATTAMNHYGRCVAHTAKGHLAQARSEREAFAAAYVAGPDTRYLFNNTSRDILAVAEAMLDGAIAYRSGDYEGAFAALRGAAAGPASSSPATNSAQVCVSQGGHGGPTLATAGVTDQLPDVPAKAGRHRDGRSSRTIYPDRLGSSPDVFGGRRRAASKQS